MLIRKLPALVFVLMLLSTRPLPPSLAQAEAPTAFGYVDFASEAAIEAKFLEVPNAKLAGEELKTLTAEPHLAATPEDRKTAEYVAEKFRAAGLETEIVPYRVLLNQPKVVRVEAYRRRRQDAHDRPHARTCCERSGPRQSACGDALQRVFWIGRRHR